MKATGVVRRIDDLGRIVIPKEIRRVLRIRESDPLEIYTDREGEIILKKYSPVKEMSSFAKQYAESLSQSTGAIAAIADRDQMIAVSGGMKQLVGKSLTEELEEAMTGRKMVHACKTDKHFIPVANDYSASFEEELISPILCQGDVIGAVMLLSTDGTTKMAEIEKKLIQTAATFIGKQMEQ